jgi:hypothetical protein
VINRFAEQLLASAATFVTSMAAVRMLDPDSLSVFFLLICGAQIALVLLAARRITPFVQGPDKVGASGLIGRRPALDVAFASLAVTCIAVLLLHRHFDTLAISAGALAALLAFALTHLLTEWLRRASAVLSPNSLPKLFLAPQALRIAGPIGLLLTPLSHPTDALVFFGVIAGSLMLAIATYYCLLRSSASAVRLQLGQGAATANAVAPLDKRTFFEAYTILAWANVPIALLAGLSGSASVARLVEIRTVVSFFNPMIEFIEVHIRRWRRDHLSGRAVWLVAGLALAFWTAVTGLILAYGDQVTSLVAGRPISGIEGAMVIFWWLQLLLVIDRLTHNLERADQAHKPRYWATVITGVCLALLTIFMVRDWGVIGCILTMCLWCIANIMLRLRHQQKKG